MNQVRRNFVIEFTISSLWHTMSSSQADRVKWAALSWRSDMPMGFLLSVSQGSSDRRLINRTINAGINPTLSTNPFQRANASCNPPLSLSRTPHCQSLMWSIGNTVKLWKLYTFMWRSIKIQYTSQDWSTLSKQLHRRIML